MEATLTSDTALRTSSRRFHLWMAAVFLLIAFGGFLPTYWAPVARGAFHQPPLTHIHGMLLFSWTLFYFLQTAWVAAGRTPTHRAWGLGGISLFSLLLCSIIALKITNMRIDDLHGYGDASRRFGAVIFCGVPVMIAFFAAAISNIRRPEVHKRLMFVLMAYMMTPAVARVFLTLLAPPGALEGGPPPPFVAVPPSLIGDLLIVVAMGYDWRTRGRPHKVYIYGLLIGIVQPIATTLFASTPMWMSIARYLEGIPGPLH